MPIYEYVCSKCGDHLEVIQKMDDKPLTRCAKCKGKLEKAISRSSFAFKGSGWYVTDYAKSGSSASKSDSASSSESSSASDKSAKSETPAKAETPATKSETKSPANTSSSKSKSD